MTVRIHLTPLAECSCAMEFTPAADKRAPMICRPHLDQLRKALDPVPGQSGPFIVATPEPERPPRPGLKRVVPR